MQRRTKGVAAVAAVAIAIAVGVVLDVERAAPAPAAEAPPAGGPHYSPFVVQMSHPALPFSQISFKDVGMSVEPAHRAFVYETIAQSLAEALTEHAEQPMSSEVLYSTDAADPNQHLACGSAHIYVDLWQSSAERYGYSLWSGCGEDDQFRWQEVDGSVEPLAHDIAEALRAAVTTKCFTRQC